MANPVNLTPVNVGGSANDGTGDSIRAAFVKVNDNFSRIEDGLIAELLQDLTVTFNGGTISGETAITNGTNTTNYTNGALTIAGGVGIAKDVNVQGNIAAAKVTTTTILGTVATANQPNITSVGKLANLSVGGNITVDNTLVASQVAAGDLTATNLNGTSITGRITDGYQPNITTIGSLENLVVTSGIFSSNLTVTVGATISDMTVSGTASVETASINEASVETLNVNTSATASNLTVTNTVSAVNANVTNATVGNLDVTGTTELTSLSVTGDSYIGDMYSEAGTFSSMTVNGTTTNNGQSVINGFTTINGNVIVSGSLFTIGSSTTSSIQGNISFGGATISGNPINLTGAIVGGTLKPDAVYAKTLIVQPPEFLPDEETVSNTDPVTEGIYGEIRFDENFLYICIDSQPTVRWKRIPLQSFGI